MGFWDTAKGHNVFDQLIGTIERVFGKERVTDTTNGKNGVVVAWQMGKAVVRYDDDTYGVAELGEIKHRK